MQIEPELTYLRMSGTLKFDLFQASRVTLTCGQQMSSKTKKATVIVVPIFCAVVVLACFVPSPAEPGTGLRAGQTCRKLLAEGEIERH